MRRQVLSSVSELIESFIHFDHHLLWIDFFKIVWFLWHAAKPTLGMFFLRVLICCIFHRTASQYLVKDM